MIYIMKTIAITIEEDMLASIDRLLEKSPAPGKNRSHIIRQAVQKYVTSLENAAEEKREREVFRRNRDRLNQQARALIKEQTKL